MDGGRKSGEGIQQYKASTLLSKLSKHLKTKN